MGKLTAKQEAFCLAVTKGMSLSDAYREAYDCTRMQPETVNKRASELACNGEITGRINELRAEAARSAVVTLEGHLNDLKRLRDKAEEAAEYAAAISAEVSRGKAAGLYKNKVEVSGGMSLDVERLEKGRQRVIDAGLGALLDGVDGKA